MPRIVLILLAIPLVVVLAAALLVSVLLDEAKILEIASSTLKQETGATLSVGGESELSFFPTIGVRLGDVAVTLPEAEEPDVTARYLNIGVALMPLLTGSIAMEALELDGLRVTVNQQPAPEKPDAEQLTDAQLDAFYAERRKQLEAQGKAAGAAVAAPLALNVQRLSITDSRVDLVDVATGKRTEVQLLNLEANGLNLDGDEIPLTAQLRFLADAEQEPVDISIEGNLTVDAEAAELKLREFTVNARGATPDVVTLVADGKVDMQRQVADLDIALSTGDTKAEGKVRYASFESPQIDADLHMNLLDPALLILAGPEAASSAADAPTTDSASGDDPLPLDALRLIDTRAELKVDMARFDGHELTDLKISLRAVEGVIELKELSGDLHGGDIDMTATFNAKHNTAKLKTQGGIKDLNLAKALAASGSGDLMAGEADLTFELQSSGATSNELIAGLLGPIRLTTEEAELKAVSVQKLVCRAVALVNQESLTKELPATSKFNDLSANIVLAGGKARLAPFSANLNDVALTGGGELELLSQDFSAEFAARLSPGLEALDPACRVNERLTAIDWPVKCKGNVAGEPGEWCGVATEDIIADLATNEAKRKLEKEAGRLLEKLFK